VRSLRYGSWLLAGLLLVSLGIKIATVRPAPGEDYAQTTIAAARLLRAEGFDVRLVRLSRSPDLLAVARRGDCRIRAGGYPVHDTFAEIYQHVARPVGPLHFVFRGQVYDRAPTFRMRVAHYLWTAQRRIGLAASPSPVIAVAASRECALEGISWDEMTPVSLDPSD
jgi:hypothetical protein